MDISARLIFIIIAFALFLFYWIFNFIIIYHLTRFGIGTLPKKLSAVFLFGSVALFFSSVIFFTGIDTANLKIQLENIGENFFNLSQMR